MDAWNNELTIQTTLGTLSIRMLKRRDEMHQAENLQKEIWWYGRDYNDYPYSARCLFEFAESGGLVAGVFLDGDMIAFSAAWIGREKDGGQFYLHSQITGVLEDYRRLGIGFLLKKYQRDYAKHINLKLIKWTFDPLLSLNANLNIRKLGAIVKNYAPNYYDRLSSRFSRGLPGDRFRAEWYIDSEWVVSKLNDNYPLPGSENSPKLITNVIINYLGFKSLDSYALHLNDEQLLVEIPDNFDELLNRDNEMAEDWQSKIREIFLHYMNQRHYIITDFLVVNESNSKKTYYLLTSKLPSSLKNQVEQS